MKVLIDTNVLISAILSNSGTPYKAFVKAVTYPNHGVICEQNIDEMRRIFNRKFPTKVSALEMFLSLALTTLEIVPIPIIEYDIEGKVRDIKDRPILRAAINAKGILPLFCSHPLQDSEKAGFLSHLLWLHFYI